MAFTRLLFSTSAPRSHISGEPKVGTGGGHLGPHRAALSEGVEKTARDLPQSFPRAHGLATAEDSPYSAAIFQGDEPTVVTQGSSCLINFC